jgi:hypothetical protein
MGRPLTQGLFLEVGYNTQYAVYTLDDDDKVYKGKTYPSLKKLFLKTGDPTEYQFAKNYLLNWSHWKRLNENKMLREHFDEWREELEVMLRSEAFVAILDMSASEQGGFQAAKLIMDRGWDKAKVGRPSKQEQQREARISERIMDAALADVERMDKYDG